MAVKVGSKIVQAAAETDVEEVTDDLKDAVETLPDTVQNIDSPIEELGPGSALSSAPLMSPTELHTLPCSCYHAPRLLELAGAGVLIYALGRYSTTKTNTLWLKTLKI